MARPPRRRPLPAKPSAAAGNSHLTPADFAFAATRTATAQIIQSTGFASVQRSALDTLAELAGRYLSAVSSSAAAATTSDGRTETNIYDVVAALEDVGSVQGFSGASNLNRRILSSSIVTDLSRFVDCSLEIPFAQAFPRLHPMPRRILGQFGQLLPGAGYRHIPGWLPDFPDIKMEKKEVKKREGLYGCFSSEETVFFNEENMVLVDGKKENLVSVDGKKENMVLVDEKTSIGLPKMRARVGCITINEENMVSVDGKKENVVLVDERTSIDLPKKRARVGCINEENMVLVDGKKENVVVFDEKTSIVLPKKRARVRFKVGVKERGFGVGSRNGVCKGGKRVFCGKNTKDNDDNDRGKKMKMMTMTMKCDSGLNIGEECGNGGLVAPLQYYRRRKRLL